ncbi:aldehyde dehydrogenase family protein, partial [Vibrio parahaemolyticus]|nr:aldehyde dehydrogenase family protein [Vibrio parahaemolyticus]
RSAKPVPFIAETGGQNAMIVDSTALPEQVVRDVIRSAFASAGQRCSALRVLFVQEDVADRMINLIQGAMNELHVGLPYLHKT